MVMMKFRRTSLFSILFLAWLAFPTGLAFGEDKITIAVGVNSTFDRSSSSFFATHLGKEIEVFFYHQAVPGDPSKTVLKVFQGKKKGKDPCWYLCPRVVGGDLPLTGSQIDLVGRWKSAQAFEAYEAYVK
jgi:hypothetical protein